MVSYYHQLCFSGSILYRHVGSCCCQSFYTRIYDCVRLLIRRYRVASRRGKYSGYYEIRKDPRSTSAVLEGESLLNDASSLIIFRFALVAVGTGQFIWQDAALSFYGW